MTEVRKGERGIQGVKHDVLRRISQGNGLQA